MDVIDTFLATFIAYIDTGFGLLAGDVAYLSTTLIVIDITLAGLFWAMSQNADVMAGLIKKVLYVGFLCLCDWKFLIPGKCDLRQFCRAWGDSCRRHHDGG